MTVVHTYFYIIVDKQRGCCSLKIQPTIICFVPICYRHVQYTCECSWVKFIITYSSVGIATVYGLDGPGNETRWGRDFLHLSRSALGPTQPPVQLGTASFPGIQRPGRGFDHPLPSSAQVKERVQLHLCSLSGSSWPTKGWKLPFLLHFADKVKVKVKQSRYRPRVAQRVAGI